MDVHQAGAIELLDNRLDKNGDVSHKTLHLRLIHQRLIHQRLIHQRLTAFQEALHPWLISHLHAEHWGSVPNGSEKDREFLHPRDRQVCVDSSSVCNPLF